MQILIFGMHRSGTSPLARIINLMGAYTGPEGSLMKPHMANPKGYWERNDVFELHQEVLKAVGGNWHGDLGCERAELDLEQLSTEQRQMFETQAREIVHNLDAHRPWVLKDPRMCLLFPLWRDLLEVPICVHIYRSPVQVAQSLHTRDGFSIRFGIALWEKYHLAALANTRGLPRVLVSHRRLMEKPVDTVQELYERLVALGVQRLFCPSEKELRAFIDPTLYRERGDEQLAGEFLTQAQLRLFQRFEDGSALEAETLPPLSAGTREALREHLDAEEKRQATQKAEMDRQIEAAQVIKLQQELDAIEQTHHAELQAKAAVEAALEEQLRARNEEGVAIRAEASALSQAKAALEEQLRARNEEVAAIRAEASALSQAKTAMEADFQEQLLAQEGALAVKTQQLSILSGELGQRSQDITRLMQWTKRLDQGLSAVLDSKRWKFGASLGTLSRRLRFLPPAPIIPDYYHDIREKFEAWKTNFSPERTRYDLARKLADVEEKVTPRPQKGQSQLANLAHVQPAENQSPHWLVPSAPDGPAFRHDPFSQPADLVKIREILHQQPDTERLLEFAIDEPKPGSQTDVYTFRVTGWALGRQAPVIAIEFVSKDAVLRRIPLQLARPDIARKYTEITWAATCGFTTYLDIMGRDADLEIGMRAVFQDEEQCDLGTLRVQRQPLQTGFQPKLQPLLLTTLGRTGSTWVTQLLGQHPQVVTYRPFQYEPRVASYWMQIFKSLSNPASYLQPLAPSSLADPQWWLGNQPPTKLTVPDPALQQWLGRGGVEELGRFCQHSIEGFYRQVAAVQEQPEACYFLEKYLPEDAVLGMLGEIYPHNREIILVRDFRDMVCSILAFNAKRGMVSFGRDAVDSDEEYIGRQRHSALRLLERWKNRKGQAHLVRYEDLIQQPEKTLESILGYLQLDASSDSVRQILERASSNKTDMQQQHQTSADPRASIGRWQRDLNPTLQAVCREAFEDILQEFGYGQAGVITVSQVEQVGQVEQVEPAAGSTVPIVLSPKPKEAEITLPISVVIPTKNAVSEDFESCLRALTKQHGVKPLEIVVVDSGSTDGTAELAKSYGATVLPIPPEQFNHGATRNYGGEQTSGELIVFMVQDAIPASENLVFEMAKMLRDDPQLAAVSVRQIPRSDADLFACWTMWNHRNFMGKETRVSSESSAALQVMSSRELRKQAGLDDVCAMYRRSIWEQFKFQPLEFAEDIEYGLRCLRAGYKIGFVEHQAVIHSHNRPAYHHLHRAYVNRKVIATLFNDIDPTKWHSLKIASIDQIYSCVRDLYTSLNQFGASLNTRQAYAPERFLELMHNFFGLSARSGNKQGPGDVTLDPLFNQLQTMLAYEVHPENPYRHAFLKTFEQHLRTFAVERYPVLEKTVLLDFMYKIYASMAGSAFGEYYASAVQSATPSEDQSEDLPEQLQHIDRLLQKGSL